MASTMKNTVGRSKSRDPSPDKKAAAAAKPPKKAGDVKKKTKSKSPDKARVKRQNSHYSQSGHIDPSLVGKRIRVFKNGDVHHKGIKVVLNAKQVPSMQAFLDVLNEKIDLQHGAKKLYTTSGLPVKDLNAIESGKEYVAATNFFTPAVYGGNKDLANKPVRPAVRPAVRANSDSGAPPKKPKAKPKVEGAPPRLRKARSAEPAVSRPKKMTIPPEARRRAASHKPKPAAETAPAAVVATRKPPIPKVHRKKQPKGFKVDPDDGLKEPIYSQSSTNGSAEESAKKKKKKKAVAKAPVVVPIVIPSPRLSATPSPVKKTAKRKPSKKPTPSPSPRRSGTPASDLSDKDSQRSYNRSATSGSRRSARSGSAASESGSARSGSAKSGSSGSRASGSRSGSQSASEASGSRSRSGSRSQSRSASERSSAGSRSRSSSAASAASSPVKTPERGRKAKK